MKQGFDFSLSFVGLLLFSPLLAILLLLVWLQDFKSPLYIAERVGLNGKMFQMVKLRSMKVGADKASTVSTSINDARITLIGHFIRAFKFDEIMQLWNVICGDMSLVGPRPNTWKHGVEIYTEQEKRLFEVKPGITDFASIVFSDEGRILSASAHPDVTYNQVIRPWKSRLGLIYVDSMNILLDIRLILITLVAIVVSRKVALAMVVKELKKLNVDEEVVKVASRSRPLTPTPPPGSDFVYQDKQPGVTH